MVRYEEFKIQSVPQSLSDLLSLKVKTDIKSESNEFSRILVSFSARNFRCNSFLSELIYCTWDNNLERKHQSNEKNRNLSERTWAFKLPEG